jgi:hypothetical protein
MTKLYENIKDGVLLCKILNVLHPDAVPGEPEGASMMQALENLSKFAGAAASIYGVDRKYLFRVLDFYNLTPAGLEGMTIFLAALAIRASEKGFTVNFPVTEAIELLEACQSDSATGANYKQLNNRGSPVGSGAPSLGRSSTMNSAMWSRTNTATRPIRDRTSASNSSNVIGNLKEFSTSLDASLNDMPVEITLAASDTDVGSKRSLSKEVLEVSVSMGRSKSKLKTVHQFPGSSPNISSVAPLLINEATRSRMTSMTPSSPQLNIVEKVAGSEGGEDALVKVQGMLDKLAKLQKMLTDKVDLAIKTSPGKAGERANANLDLLTRKMMNFDMAQRELLDVFLESFLAGTGVDYDGEYTDSQEAMAPDPAPTKSAFAGKLPAEVIAADLGKKEMIRLSVIYEMIETEQDFARDLTVMISVCLF